MGLPLVSCSPYPTTCAQVRYVHRAVHHRGSLTSGTALVLITFAIWSDRIKMRSPFILAGLTMCLIGFAINISDARIGVKYFGTFLCVSGSYAAFPGVVSW